MTKPITAKPGMTVHLDEYTVAALKQLQRQIAANGVGDVPNFTLPELARHSIRKWCDKQAAPVPFKQEAAATGKE